MKHQYNTPNFRITVFVYERESDKLVKYYVIDQRVAYGKTSFNRVTKLCSDLIESAQSMDGHRYVAYYPVYDSWAEGGSRMFESTIGAA